MIERMIHVLLVEDDPGDVMLTKKILEDVKIALRLDVVNDGVEAMAYLRREAPYAEATRPDLVLLDLNMPKKDGCAVLKELQQDTALRSIPVVVLTTSDSDSDVERAYDLGANCYITKPVGLDQFAKAICGIEDFWFTVVKLLPRKDT
ncbi:MAG: response regulator [Candidatus Tectomicrobia bacterium]|nr:response regulator [Candidatus Tectomicrobia bacterium]